MNYFVRHYYSLKVLVFHLEFYELISTFEIVNIDGCFFTSISWCENYFKRSWAFCNQILCFILKQKCKSIYNGYFRTFLWQVLLVNRVTAIGLVVKFKWMRVLYEKTAKHSEFFKILFPSSFILQKSLPAVDLMISLLDHLWLPSKNYRKEYYRIQENIS